MEQRRALITGITGQDGAYLGEFLLSKGYEVFGLYRRTSSYNFWRLRALGIDSQVHLIPGDLTDGPSLVNAVQRCSPHELYNLAAQSFVGASFDAPISTGEVDALATTRLLEIIRSISPETRFYQASSSEVFGNATDGSNKLGESTPMAPASPYAASKLYAQHITNIYREAYNLFAVSGVLFNHESPLRGLEFVTRKITNAAAQIKLGLADNIGLGNVQSHRDWGYAREYVPAMWMMLQQDEPADYVIATGESHSVAEFGRAAFGALDLDFDNYAGLDDAMLRPLDVTHLIGDSSKAAKTLGWKHQVGFGELAKIMVEADLDRWKRHMSGESFAWDVPNAIPDSLGAR